MNNTKTRLFELMHLTLVFFPSSPSAAGELPEDLEEGAADLSPHRLRVTQRRHRHLAQRPGRRTVRYRHWGECGPEDELGCDFFCIFLVQFILAQFRLSIPNKRGSVFVYDI